MTDAEPTIAPAIILSDLVVREQGTGKLSVIGWFQDFAFPAFPARIDKFFVTLAVANLRLPVERLSVVCRLEVASSGHVVQSNGFEFNVQGHAMQSHQSLHLPIPFHNVVFAQPGRYALVALVDNEEVRRQYLVVHTLPQAAPGAPATPPGLPPPAD